jgi:putative spermidine/putrescine transport system permease protein
VRARRRRPRIWRITILVLAALYFLVPLVSAIKFSLVQIDGSYGFDNYTQLFSDGALGSSLVTSLEIAALTTGIVLVLMLPTVVWVRLRLPRIAILVETVSVLPIVIPPVVMAAGLALLQSTASAQVANLLFNSPLTALTPFYVILALPFTYRSLDVGVRAIDLRTLVDAARSLGAGWTTLLVRVILPNVRTAVLTAASLTVALVLSEVVIARILLYTTYPVQVIYEGQANAGKAVALSLLSLILTWLLLLSFTFIGGRRRRMPNPLLGRMVEIGGGAP